MAMLDVARSLAEEISERAAEGEAARTMPPDLVDRLRREGLFRMAVPRSLGGLELDPVEVLEVVEEVSRADASAGWTVLIGNASAFFAWLDPAVTRAMLADGPVISTGVFAPLGRGVPVAGTDQLVLTGRWPFNSGCMHADWFQVGFLMMDGEQPATRADGQPDWRFAYLRRDEAEVLDTWRAGGLRGTGSHDVAARGVRIPVARTAMPMLDEPRHDSRLLQVGFRAYTAVLLTGFPLGVGRRAIEELEALAPGKHRWRRDVSVAEDAHTQLVLGRASAGLLAARAFAVEAFDSAWASVQAGCRPSEEQRGRMTLAAQQAMDAALTAVDTVHRLAGGSVVFEDHPLGRCFRDLHAAAQHVFFSGELFAEHGRRLLGLPVAGTGAGAVLRAR